MIAFLLSQPPNLPAMGTGAGVAFMLIGGLLVALGLWLAHRGDQRERRK